VKGDRSNYRVEAFRCRGWFINDEDHLTEWKTFEGRRNNDYKHYARVMHPDVLDKVIETALRLRMNMMDLPGALHSEILSILLSEQLVGSRRVRKEEPGRVPFEFAARQASRDIPQLCRFGEGTGIMESVARFLSGHSRIQPDVPVVGTRNFGNQEVGELLLRIEDGRPHMRQHHHAFLADQQRSGCGQVDSFGQLGQFPRRLKPTVAPDHLNGLFGCSRSAGKFEGNGLRPWPDLGRCAVVFRPDAERRC
jgi:Glycosyl hydrolase family 115